MIRKTLKPKPKVRSGVYAIRHIQSGKVYIGASNDIYYRWSRHQSSLRTKKHHSSRLQADWDKHGASAFEFLILEEVWGFPQLDKTESKYIESFESYNQFLGYNIQNKQKNVFVG